MSSDFPGNGGRRAGQRRARGARPYSGADQPGAAGPEYGHPYSGDPYPGPPAQDYQDQGYRDQDHQDQGYSGPGYQERGYPRRGHQDRGSPDRGYPGQDGPYAGHPEQAYAGAGYPRAGDTAYLNLGDAGYPDEAGSGEGDPGPGGPEPRYRAGGRAARSARRSGSPRGRSGLNRRAFIGVAAGIGVAGVGAVALSQLLPSGPKYTFADDFNGPAGSAPDPAKWAYDLGGGGWGNDELEVYTSSRQNSFLDGNGNLVIRATRTVDNGQATYHSARLKTQGTFSQYHGTFEARIKIDPQTGAWPAWWMMGKNISTVGWPKCGEVDVLENFGNRPEVDTSVHTPDASGNGALTQRATVPVDAAWHVWRVQWSRAGFTFFKDGTQYQHVAPGDLQNWVYSSGVPMFMLLNLAIGGAADVPPDNAKFPIDMLVDYVHVW